MFDDKNINDNNDLNKDETSTPETALSETSGQSTETESIEAGSSPQPQKEKKASFVHKRSFRFGSMATAFTAIFVVIVILVNVALTLLSQRFNLTLDLTNQKNYDLSADTLKYISKIKQPVTIKVFATEAQYLAISYYVTPAKIMEQYHKYNPEISIQWVDTDKNPTAASVYKNETVSTGDVIVTTTGSDNKEHYKYISGSDLLITETDSSTYSTSVVGNKTEQQIDSALDYVTSTVHPTIAFTSGHNEGDASAYQSLLKNANYTITTVNTTSTKIDESASAIAIVDPQVDFSATEITKIDTFLKNGGKYGKNIFIYLDPRYDNLKNLDEYMSEWGISVGKGVIYDSSNSFDNDIYSPISTDVDTDTAGSNISSNIGTDVKVCKPLTVLFSSKSLRTAKSIITTADTSKLVNIDKAPANSDKSGPFTAMTLSTWSDSTGENKSNMVISGSYEILDSDVLNSASKNNAKVLIGISDTLLAKKSAVSIENKYDETVTLGLTTLQSNVMVIIFIVILIILLALGFIVWLRRRHL
jgi:ABC-2 type transport system permease protein